MHDYTLKQMLVEIDPISQSARLCAALICAIKNLSLKFLEVTPLILVELGLYSFALKKQAASSY